MSEASPSETTPAGKLPLLRRLRAKVVDLIYPPGCSFCGEMLDETDGGPVLCRVCVAKMLPPPGFYCRRCAMPCPEIFVAQDFCPHCQQAKFAFSAARTFGLYERELREAVLRMKHAHEEPLAMSLGCELAGILKERPLPAEIDVVASVPMHWLKRIWRGTNAAETLATSLARELRVPLTADLVRCRRMLRKQGMLLPGERHDNVRGAFAVSKSIDIRGCTVLIVDDVVTTGSTADAIGRVLRAAGAAEVFVVAVARGTGTP